MNANDFFNVEGILELGETIFCVYFYNVDDVNKYKQFLLWKGFKVNLMYEFDTFNNRVVVFYQDEKFVPDLDSVDKFYHTVSESNIWEKCPSGTEHDYRYRIINKGIVCVSFIHIENAEAIEKARKVKKE